MYLPESFTPNMLIGLPIDLQEKVKDYIYSHDAYIEYLKNRDWDKLQLLIDRGFPKDKDCFSEKEKAQFTPRLRQGFESTMHGFFADITHTLNIWKDSQILELMAPNFFQCRDWGANYFLNMYFSISSNKEAIVKYSKELLNSVNSRNMPFVSILNSVISNPHHEIYLEVLKIKDYVANTKKSYIHDPLYIYHTGNSINPNFQSWTHYYEYMLPKSIDENMSFIKTNHGVEFSANDCFKMVFKKIWDKLNHAIENKNEIELIDIKNFMIKEYEKRFNIKDPLLINLDLNVHGFKVAELDLSYGYATNTQNSSMVIKKRMYDKKVEDTADRIHLLLPTILKELSVDQYLDLLEKAAKYDKRFEVFRQYGNLQETLPIKPSLDRKNKI